LESFGCLPRFGAGPLRVACGIDILDFASSESSASALIDSVKGGSPKGLRVGRIDHFRVRGDSDT